MCPATKKTPVLSFPTPNTEADPGEALPCLFIAREWREYDNLAEIDLPRGTM